MEKFLAALAVFLLLLAFGCASLPSGSQAIPQKANGTLVGKVSMGPQCPVEPCDPLPNYGEVYGNMKVFAYKSGVKAAETQLSSDGSYLLYLPPGEYIIDVSNPAGVELGLANRPPVGAAIPQAVTVKSNEQVRADFDIDTGVR